MRRWTSGLLALLGALVFTVPAHAQGGGASSTGTIQGRIHDPQGALLPGVTVTTTSPSALGVQTTVKANYGFFWHSPCIGVSTDGNPNTTAKSATYTWNDRNGDRRWQPGEESAAPTSASLEGSIGVSPVTQPEGA